MYTYFYICTYIFTHTFVIIGVIALFNAISQSKREEVEEGTEKLSSSKEKAQRDENISDIKQMTQSNLIDLLTSSVRKCHCGILILICFIHTFCRYAK